MYIHIYGEVAEISELVATGLATHTAIVLYSVFEYSK
jgi:hypothetical protein